VPYLLKRALPVILLLLIGTSLYSASLPDPFWADKINSALSKRNSYFSMIGISGDSLKVDSWTSKRREEVRKSLDLAQSPENPWYNFLMGTLYLNLLPATKSDYHFKNALNIAQNDPGMIWTLFVEFSRLKLYTWADSCLNLLEKQMFVSGAISAPIISQKLIQSALINEKQGNSQFASTLFDRSKKFNPCQTWTIGHQILNGFPFKQSGFSAIPEYIYILKHSWAAQVGFLETLYLFFRNILFAFLIITFVILCWKYFPKAIHSLSDLYPLSIPPLLRQLLTVLVVCSLAAFGIIPFLWLCTILIWKYTAKMDKGVLTAATIVLMCSPIDIRIQDMMHQALNPSNELNLFSRSVKEGYSESLIRAAHVLTEKSPSNSQAWLSLSNCALKEGDFNLAFTSIGHAEQLQPRDPVVLVTAGNLAFCKGNIEKAKFYYSQALSKGAQDVSSRFNLAQCRFQKLETISGADLIKNAARAEPALINAFVQKNDLYFSKQWPLLRTIMFPDYTPEYFWTKLFLTYSGSWKTTGKLWGSSFLGIPPLLSLIIFIVFFALLLIIYSPERLKHKPRKIMECRYCGRVICQKCRTATVCQSCADQTRLLRSDRALNKFQSEIAQRNWVYRSITHNIFDVLFPGAGKFLDGQNYIYSTILLITTSTIYTLYLMIITGQQKYQTEFNVFIVILFAYNILFGWKRISSLIAILNKNYVRSS
jgi:tetratricopeptide (TPR) repeat protein